MPSVLIVDASDAARAAVTETLRDSGYCVHTAVDAREAEQLAAALGATPCVALLDFRSLGNGAASLPQRLRQRWPGLPIIFLAGALPSEDEALGHALAAPGTTLLVKPTSLDTILASIRPHAAHGLERSQR